MNTNGHEYRWPSFNHQRPPIASATLLLGQHFESFAGHLLDIGFTPPLTTRAFCKIRSGKEILPATLRFCLLQYPVRPGEKCCLTTKSTKITNYIFCAFCGHSRQPSRCRILQKTQIIIPFICVHSCPLVVRLFLLPSIKPRPPPASTLIELQIALDFPIGDVALVLDPLHLLQIRELLQEGLSQLFGKQGIGLEGVQGFLQGLGEHADAHLP